MLIKPVRWNDLVTWGSDCKDYVPGQGGCCAKSEYCLWGKQGYFGVRTSEVWAWSCCGILDKTYDKASAEADQRNEDAVKKSKEGKA